MPACFWQNTPHHYDDVIMSLMASQITSLMIVYSTSYSGVVQRKHQSSALMAFVRGIHRGPVNSPHKGPVTRKMFPFHDVIMCAVRLRFQCGQLSKYSQWIPYTSPVMVGCGLALVSFKYNLWSALVITMPRSILYYTSLCYNDPMINHYSVKN